MYSRHGVNTLRIISPGLLALSLWVAESRTAKGDTNFIVTTPNLIYEINGVAPTNSPGFFVNNCPPLTLFAGRTYTFTMQAASIHPMVVGTNASSGTPPPSSFEYSNAAPQAIASGVITLNLPATNFPTTLYYQCNVHGFYGVITVLPPPIPPPPNEIVSISATTNVVLISTGSNTSFVLVPQFSSNLVNGVWGSVPGFTNSFANGTNVTTFDRLDQICGPSVFLRISQQPPN
jgi:hypothetical protein